MVEIDNSVIREHKNVVEADNSVDRVRKGGGAGHQQNPYAINV